MPVLYQAVAWQSLSPYTEIGHTAKLNITRGRGGRPSRPLVRLKGRFATEKLPKFPLLPFVTHTDFFWCCYNLIRYVHLTCFRILRLLIVHHLHLSPRQLSPQLPRAGFLGHVPPQEQLPVGSGRCLVGYLLPSRIPDSEIPVACSTVSEGD